MTVAPLTGAILTPQSPTRRRRTSFTLEEATISTLQTAMQQSKMSAHSIAKAFLKRIRDIDTSGPTLNSVIELNPDALDIARQLDLERKSKGPRGPLHGIPILLKDNIDTGDRMMTTAGSLALTGFTAQKDAFLAAKLRAAGAVILGKCNLSEWANFRSNRSTSGWSARGGLTKNPYDILRNPSGSSSGSAVSVSASLCAAAIGTETDGSIVSPSAVCGIVGIKPTLGLVSRSGIIPIAHSQDTAGPMARTVADAALLLNALAGSDPSDPATAHCPKVPNYSDFLIRDGLRGARIGVARRFFRTGVPSEPVLEAALALLQRNGAILVDPADLPSHGSFGDSEFEVLLYEFKADLNAYLAGRTNRSHVRDLEHLIQFNIDHQAREMPHFGQETFLKAQAKGPLTEKSYLDALTRARRLTREEGIDAIMNQHQLDALVAPSGGPAAATDLLYGNRGVGGSSSPAAVAGYPNITVPAGHVMGLPIGLSFFGRAFSEPTLIKLAYAFEQASQSRLIPRFTQPPHSL